MTSGTDQTRSRRSLARHVAALLLLAPACSAFAPTPSVLLGRARASSSAASRPSRAPFTPLMTIGEAACPTEAAEAAISAYSPGSSDDSNEAAAISRLGFDMVMVRSSLKLDQRIRHKTSVSSALFAAVHMKRCDMVNALLQLGANHAERDGKGRTPLMVAAVKGDLDTIKLLLLRGASALARDADGDTALLLAARANQVQSVELLRKPAVSLHHLYSPPHFKSFLWLSGTGITEGGGVSEEGAEQVRDAVMQRKAVPLCKMNLDMVSINAALRLDTVLDTPPPARPTSPVVAATATIPDGISGMSP